MSNLKTLRIFSISVVSLLVCLFAAIPSEALAANPNAAKDSDTMTSATLVCGGAYWVDQSIKSTGRENAANWSIRNINDDQSVYINRIRVYDYDGGLYRDFLWTGTEFYDANYPEAHIPADGNGNISGTDNELGPMQPIAYNHQMLYQAGVMPEHTVGNPTQVTLVIDWHADERVYPLSGALTRLRGDVFVIPGTDVFDAFMGRTSYDCTVINKVYK